MYFEYYIINYKYNKIVPNIIKRKLKISKTTITRLFLIVNKYNEITIEIPMPTINRVVVTINIFLKLNSPRTTPGEPFL